MKQIVTLLVLLSLFWLGLSGYLTAWFLGLGIVSLIMVMLLIERQRIIDASLLPPSLLLRLPRYWVWLLKEIFLSNLHITRVIWSPRMDINPRFQQVPCHWNREITRVIHANSITLTPGTTTVDMDQDSLVVHSLTDTSARSLSAENIRQQLQRLEQ